MEQFVQENDSTILFAAMIFVLVIASVLEEFLPRRTNLPDTKQRWFNNISLTLIGEVCVNLVSTGAAITAAWWAESVGIGLFSGNALGFWPTLLVAILSFEFVSYWFHRALHAIPWLWRIHAIHHSDTELDFTTTFRNHPIELFINAPLTIPIILLMGFPVLVVTAYQLLKISISIIAHSNIKFPAKVDKIVRKVIITPDYHRLHHCSDRQFTDSNFSASFPIFDYIFGTAKIRPYDDHEKMELGLEYFRDPADSRVDRLLMMPFTWRKKSQNKSAIPEET